MKSIHDLGFGTEILVYAVYDGLGYWFISWKEYWLLDYNKFPDFMDGFVGEHSRYGIDVLDKDSFPRLLSELGSDRVWSPSLQEQFEVYLPLKNWEEHGDLFPSLYVDFDQKELVSTVAEGTPFEEFVPSGWVGRFGLFLDLVPQPERYWVVNGEDHSLKIFGLDKQQ